MGRGGQNPCGYQRPNAEQKNLQSQEAFLELGPSETDATRLDKLLRNHKFDEKDLANAGDERHFGQSVGANAQKWQQFAHSLAPTPHEAVARHGCEQEAKTALFRKIPTRP